MFHPNVSIFTMILSNFTIGINDGPFKCGPLYITVNHKTEIVLNWDSRNCVRHLYPEKIKLYKIRSHLDIFELEIETFGALRGSYKTKSRFPKSVSNFPGRWNKHDISPKYGSHCMPLVIESIRKNDVIDRRCYRIYPSWMQKYGSMRLGELMIPGTHNSGAWTGVAPYLSNYVYNQDRNLYEQLVFGQRYFDVRVGISPEDNTMYITHNVVQTSKLIDELENIVAFIKKSPKEIIVIDIHKFNVPANFQQAHHEKLLKVLEEKIGKYIIPRMYRGINMHGPKLNTLWKTGKSIIIAYADKETMEKNPPLWPPVRRFWGNKRTEKELLQYIIKVAGTTIPGNPMEVLMAEMTPNLVYILTNPLKSLGYLADLINKNITNWLCDNKLEKKVNIIASDFFFRKFFDRA